MANKRRRLVDYFAVIGYDHGKERNEISVGKVLQRFPINDWADVPFFNGLELFCQPQGWRLLSKWQPATFYVSVLTDIGADRHYAASLRFLELHSKNSDFEDQDLDDEEITESSSPVHHSASRKTSLSAVAGKMNYGLEDIIATLIACIKVPHFGEAPVPFSLGAGDCHLLRVPNSVSIPSSNGSTLLLFRQLGIHNVVTLVNCLLTERKILVFSQSYRRLTEACSGFLALIYPVKIGHVYVPVLPAALLEVLSNPTPFVMGLHSAHRGAAAEYFYEQPIVAVDLDLGSVILPESMKLSSIPEPYLKSLVTSLTLVLDKNVFTGDYAFITPSLPQELFSLSHKEPSQQGAKESWEHEKNELWQDMCVRSCFLQFFAHLLMDYRFFLQIVRVFPRPFIAFHKAAFLGARDLSDDDFMCKLMDSMAFETFAQERGIPFRPCDLFDQVHSHTDLCDFVSSSDLQTIEATTKELARKFMQNERPVPKTPINEKPLRPSEETLHPTFSGNESLILPSFPRLDSEKIQTLIDEEILGKPDDKSEGPPNRSQVVPVGKSSRMVTYPDRLDGNARRLDVLKSCLKCIFEDKISDARKMISAVLMAMKRSVIRVAFCRELEANLKHGGSASQKSTLKPAQFDLLCKVMNCALQNESHNDEYGVAYALMTLATYYSRKLSAGVIQFAYSCIQDHPVWINQQFWEASFYHDVQEQLRNFYASQEKPPVPLAPSAMAGRPSDLWNMYQSPSALDIAARQLQKAHSEAGQKALGEQEEQIVYSQAIHYANRMVYFLIPLDSKRLRRVNLHALDEGASSTNSNVTQRRSSIGAGSSVSDSNSSESGFEDAQGEDIGSETAKFISKFVDKVGANAEISSDHMRQLHQMIPGAVAMHVETLESVHKESKRLPTVHKPKMLTPAFVPNEKMVLGHYRAYLLPDGRSEEFGKLTERTGGNQILPAEGTLFLTNYRVIFKGQPCDTYLSEQVVIRSVPIMSISKEKRLGQQFLPLGDQSGQCLREGLQIRTATFQLLKLAFDDEITAEKVDAFVHALNQLRWPEFLSSSAFAMVGSEQSENYKTLQPDRKRYGAARKKIKSVWKETKRRTGFKAHKSHHKHHLKVTVSDHSSSATPPTIRTGHVAGAPVASDEESNSVSGSEYGDPCGGHTLTNNGNTLCSGRALGSCYYSDYTRMGLCTPADIALYSGGTKATMQYGAETGGFAQGTPGLSRGQFRLSGINALYGLVRSYPAIFTIPSSVSDESLRRLSKGHKQGRFPVVVWAGTKGALLMRSASLHMKNVVKRLKSQTYQGFQQATGTASPASYTSGTKTKVEQERYFNLVASMTPSGRLSNSAHLSASSESLLSLESLFLSSLDSGSVTGVMTSSPETIRRNYTGSSGVSTVSNPSVQKMFSNTIRGSGGKGPTHFGTLRGHRGGAGVSLTLGPMNYAQKRLSTQGMNPAGSRSDLHALQRASLYIFGEKHQAKALKLNPAVEFIPLDYMDARECKLVFKKFMKVVVPSALAPGEPTFLRQLMETGWLQGIDYLLRASCALVDLLDIQNSSVCISLEDGWDVTAQLSSLTQILLDPYYRTIQGIQIVIEKEWLAFGHRFSHRCNHTADSQTSGYAPIFLQFLDALHQVLLQFPAAFEFNDYFLRFLAYHSNSCYFQTFLFDSEVDRLEAGIATQADPPHYRRHHHGNKWATSVDHDSTFTFTPRLEEGGEDGTFAANVPYFSSIWHYVAWKHSQGPTFYNFLYNPETCEVLRPEFGTANFDLWSYYTQDALSHGSTYDIEVAEAELAERQADQSDMYELLAGSIGTAGLIRKVVDLFSGDSADLEQQSGFENLMSEIISQEMEYRRHPSSWTKLWSDVKREVAEIEALSSEEADDVSTPPQIWADWLSRALHKKATIELLLKGKRTSGALRNLPEEAGENDGDGSPHRFQKYNFAGPTNCDVCGQVLWGMMKHGYHCVSCGFNCHDKCLVNAPDSCQQQQPRHPSGAFGGNSSPGSSSPRVSSQSRGRRESERGAVVSDSPSPPDTLRLGGSGAPPTHEGYLYKRGALLKAWKPRWFVLDSEKHQLRYFEGKDDPQLRGVIELFEVTSLGVTHSIPAGAPRKHDGVFFDLRTTKRVYSFMANDKKTADVWIEKIQQCLNA